MKTKRVFNILIIQIQKSLIKKRGTPQDDDILKDEVLLMVSCPIFPSILIAKNLLTGSLKNRSIDNLETQK
jgi:hypothetical protein